jgi:transcriptional regulator GlxA family with amidase domain
VDWRQDSLVERDDLILTSGGGTAAIDLALELVSERGGEALSRTVAAGLLFDPHRGPQGRYFHIAHDAVAQDALVAQAQQKLVERLAAPPSVAELASDLNITARTLLRRFRAATGFTVQGYLQRVRMDAARDLLADGRVGVDAAMDAVGYEDRASFTRSFSRHFGMGPGAYRRAR